MLRKNLKRNPKKRKNLKKKKESSEFALFCSLSFIESFSSPKLLSRNYKLLSFGEEAEEDELETLEETKKFEGKSKSTHDCLDDPKLSSQTILDVETPAEIEPDREQIE